MSASRESRWIRPALLVVAVPHALTGVLALVAPRSFYSDFPLPGRRWVGSLGPYDEHLVTDVGAALLALGGLVVLAALLLDRRLLQGALAAWLVFATPHLVFHATHTGALPPADEVANLLLLATAVAVPAAALVTTLRAPGPASPSTAPDP